MYGLLLFGAVFLGVFLWGKGGIRDKMVKPILFKITLILYYFLGWQRVVSFFIKGTEMHNINHFWQKWMGKMATEDSPFPPAHPPLRIIYIIVFEVLQIAVPSPTEPPSWIQMTKDFFFLDRATYRLWRTFPRSIPAHIHFWYPGLLQDQVEIAWRGRDRVEGIQHKIIPLSPASPPDASCFPKLLSWEQTALSVRTAQGSCKLGIDWSQPYQIFEMRMLSVVHTL